MGSAKMVSMLLGLSMKRLFGKNSAVTKTMMVEITVCKIKMTAC